MKLLKIWFIFKENSHSDVINQIEISPNGKYVLSCSNDKYIKMWELLTP